MKGTDNLFFIVCHTRSRVYLTIPSSLVQIALNWMVKSQNVCPGSVKAPKGSLEFLMTAGWI